MKGVYYMTLDNWFDTINAIVREFVRSFDEEYDCRMSTNFCACLTENTIEWSLLFVEPAGEAFYNNFIARYPAASNLNFFMLAILHEIGHLETEWEMVDDIDERNKELSNEEYFKLFNERIATDWAGEWIENNTITAHNINEKFNKVLNEFYKEVLD